LNLKMRTHLKLVSGNGTFRGLSQTGETVPLILSSLLQIVMVVPVGCDSPLQIVMAVPVGCDNPLQIGALFFTQRGLSHPTR
jgi:hypothetical protein